MIQGVRSVSTLDKSDRDDVLVNELVDRYKLSNSSEIKIAILNAFDFYFKKYCGLLCTKSSVDLSNNDTIKFLRLFMSKEDRANNESIFIAAKRIISFLRSLFLDQTQQDVYDELVCIFLEQLERYQPMITKNKAVKERISFVHFVQVNIRYKLAALVQRRSKDAMHRSSNISFMEAYLEANSIDPRVNWAPIDMCWVKNETTSDIFKELTEMERYLIYLKFENEDKNPLSDYDVARITGLDRMYIRRKFLSIQQKLKQLV